MRKRTRPLRWYIIWYLILFFFLAAVFSVLLTLPVWQIKSVKVTGAQIISPKVVEGIAKVPMGKNVFFADLGESIERLRAIKQIKDFGIYRSLPSTLVIKIIERKPLAVVQIGKESAIIDEEGVILKKANGKGVGKFNVDADVGDISAFPVVRGIKKEMVKDESLDRDIAGSIGGALTKLEVFLKPSSLQLDFADPGDISLLVEDMLRVKLGDMEKLSSKIDVLEALLPQVEGKWNDVGYIDIRYINNPVIKMRH